MRTSYNENDVTLLLKDITGLVAPQPASEREVLIQSGTHYSEMLPLEYRPSERYMEAYDRAIKQYSKTTAAATAVLSHKIHDRKKNPVIVSLARAGIPIGILLKHYFKRFFGEDIPHYAISIIRDRGIDKNAMNYILDRHAPQDIVFVDGWIGKGTILRELKAALADFEGVDPEPAVLSDPACLTSLCGTHEDFLIPSSCLNATVTGLISRTFLRSDIIGENDFHGAAYYEELIPFDRSAEFLQSVEQYFEDAPAVHEGSSRRDSQSVIRDIAETYQVPDINFIKPGIGEATRVLLRRIPKMIIVKEEYLHSEELEHICRLAEEKNVPVEISRIDLGNYKVCGIIQALSDI